MNSSCCTVCKYFNEIEDATGLCGNEDLNNMFDNDIRFQEKLVVEKDFGCIYYENIKEELKSVNITFYDDGTYSSFSSESYDCGNKFKELYKKAKFG